ncbi:MAG: lytic transglycosylase domain-containing protein [Bacteriovoracaceae bacterium]|nr:lytic transglycosylase domain-containing protein [Bacteriovoracaceae bacterium]
MIKLLSFAFPFFFLILSSAQESGSDKIETLHDVLNSTYFNPSPEQISLGESILSFYDDPKKFDEISIKTLEESLASENIFKIYQEAVKKIYQALNVTSIFSFHDLCSQAKGNTPLSISQWEVKLQATCRDSFIRLIKLIPANLTFKENSKIFLRAQLKNYIQDKKWGDLDIILQRSSLDPIFHQQISDLISLNFIKKDALIPQQINSRLSIGIGVKEEVKKQKTQQENFSQFSSEFNVLTDRMYELLKEPEPSARYKNYILGKIIDLYKKYKTKTSLEKVQNVLVILAKELQQKGDQTIALKMYHHILENVTPDYKDEALFLVLWTYLLQKNYTEAFSFIKKYSLESNLGALSSKNRFWIAYAYEQTNALEKSKAIYQNIITQDPLSAYAILAAKKITFNSRDTYKKLLDKNSIQTQITTEKINALKNNPDFLASILRMKIWNIKTSKPMIDMEFSTLKEVTGDIQLSSNAICKIINSFQNYFACFTLLTNLLDQKKIVLDYATLSSLFPTPYFDEMKKYQEIIDPYVYLSLTRQESTFNPKAKSGVGAIGLMQLMPKTARSISSKVTLKELENPAINIKLGTYYFDFLYKKYNGNLAYILASYNAGDSRVDKWRKEFLNHDILNTMEFIPYKETRKYVKFIFRNIYFYKLLYTELKDSQDLNQIFDITVFKH